MDCINNASQDLKDGSDVFVLHFERGYQSRQFIFQKWFALVFLSQSLVKLCSYHSALVRIWLQRKHS